MAHLISYYGTVATDRLGAISALLRRRALTQQVDAVWPSARAPPPPLARGAEAQQLRRCGLLVPCARSAAEPRALRPAATGCWCPVPAPSPGGRPRRRRPSPGAAPPPPGSPWRGLLRRCQSTNAWAGGPFLVGRDFASRNLQIAVGYYL
jgi:hypothetical protein